MTQVLVLRRLGGGNRNLTSPNPKLAPTQSPNPKLTLIPNPKFTQTHVAAAIHRLPCNPGGLGNVEINTKNTSAVPF